MLKADFQIEDEASQLEARARQLRSIHRQRRQAIEDRLAAARRRLTDLQVAQAQTPDVQDVVDSSSAVKEAHRSFVEAQGSLTAFQRRFLPRHVPADKQGELDRLRDTAIAAEQKYREASESAHRQAVAEKKAAVAAEAAALEREIEELETRLATIAR